MYLRTIYKFASDRTMHKLVVYLATVFLCCATFSLLLTSFFTWQYLKKERTACDRCLNGGIKQAGMIYFETYWRDETSQDFLQDIMNLDEIVGLTGGNIYFVKRDTIKEIGEQQEAWKVEFDDNKDTLQWFVMNPEGVDVCQFNIKEGKHPEEWKLEDGEHLIYLGSNIKNIGVGEKYYDSEEKMTYLVGGILEKGTGWIYDDVYIFGAVTDSRYVQNLDSSVIEIYDTLISARNTYIVKEGYQIEDAEQKLQELAQQHDVDIRLARLEDVIDENEANYADVLDLIGRTTVIIVETVMILLLCTQFSAMLSDSEYFGIFYANGASTKDLTAILLGENLLKVIISYLIAAVGGYFVLKHNWQEFQPGIDNWRSASSIYLGQALLPTFLVGVMMIGLATVIPILWLKQKKPMELIQGYKA